MTDLPDDIAVLKAALAVTERRADLAEADAAHAKANAFGIEALVVHLKLQIEKLKRELCGTRSERTARLLDQLELQREDAEAALSEDEIAVEEAAAKTRTIAIPKRPRRGSCQPFPKHLPRERVVMSGPSACKCCGSDRLAQSRRGRHRDAAGDPARWKMIKTVRLPGLRRITQPPAPLHVTPLGFLGPNLLATILFEKFGQHRPLNRQSERYAHEGINLPLSTLADQVGACTSALRPLHELIERHLPSDERLHRDDTTVPILSKGETVTGRIWTYYATIAPSAVRRRRRRFTLPPPDRTAEQPETHLKE